MKKRQIIQVATAIFYNLNFLGFKNATIYKGQIKMFCTPGLNCYSCPGAVLSCPLGAFQSFVNQKSKTISILSRIPIYVLGVLIFFGIIFGRIICGFLCPFGFLQDLIYKIKSPKIKKSKLTKIFSYMKYFILIIFVVLIPFAFRETAFCKYICPVGTLEAGLPHIIMNKSLQNSIGYLFDIKLLILTIVLIMSIFLYRFFCRFICPLGAFYGLFNKISILGLKIDETKCTHCNICVDTCKMDVKKVGDSECIECGECINKCKQKAIYRFKEFES